MQLINEMDFLATPVDQITIKQEPAVNAFENTELQLWREKLIK